MAKVVKLLTYVFAFIGVLVTAGGGYVYANNPELVSERGLALRVLLYLFEKDAVVKTIRSG